jgi:diadenosine tetraphosphate (Ap4A) HIT family hydrolase
MSVFLEINNEDKIYSGVNFFLIKDRFPVSPGHVLIISNDLKKDLIEKDYNPDGYNIGMNCGETAGQTVFHFHCHIIPRYKGDMENPRGGVRHCIIGKGNY